jgi:hypothetical protein
VPWRGPGGIDAVVVQLRGQLRLLHAREGHGRWVLEFRGHGRGWPWGRLRIGVVLRLRLRRRVVLRG